MLASGAGLTRRAHRVWSEDVAAGDGVLRLGLRRRGVYGVVFVVSAPLIVAAAVALRYVHILSHVAESSGSCSREAGRIAVDDPFPHPV